MNTIWIVERSSGEYEDYREAPVKAFASHEAAKELVDKAQARAEEIAAFKRKVDDWEKIWNMCKKPKPSKKVLNEFDPDCSAGETHEQKYYCYPIEFVADLLPRRTSPQGGI
ncbi:MAG TPA: hypothetical protein VGP89_18105 [Candidatus Angelobacter sp.]|jgi:hypothetical protein|nr:hypothetical protein [Candidatus Angelobacter sp.]